MTFILFGGNKGFTKARSLPISCLINVDSCIADTSTLLPFFGLNITKISLASSITWAFVIIAPSSLITTPLPRAISV